MTKPTASVLIHTCERCGAQVQYKSGPWPRLCRSCFLLKQRERMAANRAAVRVEIPVGACPQCGAAFQPRHKNHVYCSTKCAFHARGDVGWGSGRKGPAKGSTQTEEHKMKRAASVAATLSKQRRTCRECGEAYTPTLPAQAYCSGRCWTAVSRRKKSTRDALRVFPTEYLQLVEKFGNTCNICGAAPHLPGSGQGKGRLCVDHIHRTTEIRGLLCHKCNTAIGLLQDDPGLTEIATTYLKRAKLDSAT